MIGEFKGGRGEFFNQEALNGRAIFVRFIFSDITTNSFRLEQAFSDDGGKTWEANWIATFSRSKNDSEEPGEMAHAKPGMLRCQLCFQDGSAPTWRRI